jgi:ABC-type uncharacterized transport system auxiliary subunit
MKPGIPAIILMGALFLSACMPFGSSKPAPLIYALHGPSGPERQTRKNIARVISISTPEVPAGFDTDKIALYLYNKRRLDYYANAVWPDHLGKVLQRITIESARALPDVVAVDPASGIPASIELQVKVNDFEPIYAASANAPPQLKVSLSFRLLSSGSRRILFDKTYSATAPARENTQTAIVSGLEALLHSVDAKAFREIRYTP